MNENAENKRREKKMIKGRNERENRWIERGEKKERERDENNV